MLQVFLVDTGSMLAFDMTLTFQTVGQLKEAIEQSCKIPIEKQVLMINGGECLDSAAPVYTYSAGTDTNPIFLFSTSTIECAEPPSPSMDLGSDSDLEEHLEVALALPPLYTTVVARCQLAQQFHDFAIEEAQACERLVHEQHLQQQGWAAVVANLEDITSEPQAQSNSIWEIIMENGESVQVARVFEASKIDLAKSSELHQCQMIMSCFVANISHEMLQDDWSPAKSTSILEQTLKVVLTADILKCYSDAFKTKADVFKYNFEAYLENRQHYIDVLKEFTSDLELLSRIPVLEPLLRANKDKIESDVTDQHSVSLHQWICSKDHQNSLEMIADLCRKGLEQFQVNTYKNLQAEIANALLSVNYPAMKEIKGLEERLYGLDQLMSEARKIVTQQAETAQAFSQNKMRAANIGDMSILPDLCASHRDQLKVMLMMHKQLRDVHRRCLHAKIELAENLHVRLRWIMVVERRLNDSDSNLVIYHESLKRLKRHLDVAQQIHLAPIVYLRSVVEVVRRRAFSKEFLKWSKVLSHQAADLHKKEMTVRREFTSRVGNHFLYSLFPGMNDSPPPYALETPEEFDAELPDIQPADVETLKALLPDIAASLNVPEVDFMPNVAMGSLDPTSCLPPTEKSNEDPVAPLPSYLVDSGSNVEPLSGRDCYLSALTNVQSVIAAAHTGQEKVLKMEPAMGDVLLESPRDERDPDESNLTLKSSKRWMAGLQSMMPENSEKIEELNALKHAQSLEENRFSKSLQEEMDKLTDRLQEDFLIREQFSIAKSLEEAKQTFEAEIKWLRQKNKDLSDACDQKVDQISCLAKEFEAKADQELKELKDSLAKEHKQEMEGLRARFRLAFNVAGMERSPSDSSLEKIERPDSADPSRIEQQVSILKAELEEKDAAIFDMKQKHQIEMADLAQQIKKARSDSFKYMRTSLTAEKQVVFNEAVNNATAEKEAIIQDLKLQLKTLREELQDERLLNDRVKLKDESFTFSLTSERSESSPVLSRPDSGNFHMVSPVTPRRSESSGLLGASIVVSPVSEQPPDTETNSLEIGEPSGLLGASVFVSPVSEQPPETEAMEGSSSASAAKANVPEKVSVYTCNIGDLVILLYDDRRENYMVFTASSTYHFLHHDCFELLSLSQSTLGEKCNWLLAHITSKEYCQARKEQNRFKVPIGTRFYRVRAKPVPHSTLRRSQYSSKKKLSAQTGGGSL